MLLVDPILPPGRFAAAVVFDPDGTGRPAVLLVGAGPNRLLRWAGGRLADVTPPALADPAAVATAAAAGDLDGDGVEEVYVAVADGPDRLFKRHPGGNWEDLLARPENRGLRPTGGRAVAVIDRRGVGRYGFAVATEGRLRLIEAGPDGRLADVAPSLDLPHPAGGRGLLAAPLFGPPTDLFALAEAGPNRLLRNRGDGTFDDLAEFAGAADADEPGRAAAVVGGGGVGLCWANADGPHRLLVPQPEGAWRDRASPAFALPSAARAVLAADFDNDGRDELLVLNHGEPNRLFRLGGFGGTGLPAGDPELVMVDPGHLAEPDGSAAGAVAADLDGDGVLELLVAGGGSGGLFRAAAAGGWLRIAPFTRFGAPARGATVTAEVGGRRRVKVIDGGPSEPVAHFGLGSASGVERVTVTWPDGVELTLPDPDVNCTYLVPYPGG